MTAHRPVICQDCRLIGDIDTLIAATAFEQNLTILTIDRDFERVPHLPVKLVDLKGA
ncbi:MAG: PIN domain-containing protein [Ktedonobacteraceae bacterium]